MYAMFILLSNYLATTSIVLFLWQQLTVTDSLKFVKTLSKKFIEETFVFPVKDQN